MGALGLTVLAVDDEPAALLELGRLLGDDPRVDTVLTARSSLEAARVLAAEGVDAVFLDVLLPGRNGVELARSMAQRPGSPPVVFVTASDAHAVAAFDLGAVDYVLKPIGPERLAEAVRRVAATQRPPRPVLPAQAEPIAIELAGVTRFVHRNDVRYVEAQGDYARLHTATGSHLVRIPMATLADRWASAGFVRIHRSYLVALTHVEEVRMGAGRASVVLAGTELPVSRRAGRALREVLARRSVRA
ncbi:MAG: LytR/AlgR family response regulator transcription factor [Sporichthyaceae bacterium]